MHCCFQALHTSIYHTICSFFQFPHSPAIFHLQYLNLIPISIVCFLFSPNHVEGSPRTYPDILNISKASHWCNLATNKWIGLTAQAWMLSCRVTQLTVRLRTVRLLYSQWLDRFFVSHAEIFALRGSFKDLTHCTFWFYPKLYSDCKWN